MTVRTRIEAAVGLTVATLLVGCAAAADVCAPGAELVNIGYSGPLSGGAAFYGGNVQTGLQMAIDEINEAGGIEIGGSGESEAQRVCFALVSLDDRYLPNETGTNVRRLVQQSGASVIFVPHEGGILAAQGIRDVDFLLMAYSSAPSVLEAGHPRTIMIPPRYDNYQEPFTRVLMERFGPKLGILPTTTTYGKSWTDAIIAEWQRQGGQVTRNYGVDYNTTTDFSSVVTQVLAERPDVLFLGGPSQPTALIIKAAREQGFQGGLLLMDQPKFEEMLEVIPLSYLEGAIGVHPSETYPAPGTPEFVAKFRAREGPDRPLVSEVGLNYQAMHIVARAMEIAGTTDDPDRIRAAVPQAVARLPEELKISEIAQVTDRGHLTRNVFVAHVVNGEFVPIPVPTVR